MTDTAKKKKAELSLGQLLKKARLARRLTLKQVAQTLRIGVRHLTSLEEDKNLVCDVYTLGFLRTYTRYLGLDENDFCEKFKEQALHPKPAHLAYTAPLPGKGMPSFPLLALSFLVLLGITAGWAWWDHYGAAPQSYKAHTPLIESSPAPQIEAAPPLPLQTHSPQEESLINEPEEVVAFQKSESVLLKATEKTWVEVKDETGKVILDRVFAPGEEYEFKNPQHLTLRTGNAPGMQLISGDKALTFIKNVERVKSNILLDPEKWVEQNPKTH